MFDELFDFEVWKMLIKIAKLFYLFLSLQALF